jgi:UDP-N-acetylmuramate--alanine ligase
MFQKKKNIYGIGVGGSGMSGLVRLLQEWGFSVSGSDESDSPMMADLQKAGITIHIGQRAENIPQDTELVIYSTAVPETNPERIEAEKRGLRQISYPQAVGEITRQKKTIAVCGTHGKTTTSAMMAAALLAAEKDPTVLIGSQIHELQGRSERAGQGDFFVLEACEYQRAFLNFSPHVIVITNIEPDHLDYYKDLQDYRHAFEEFIQKLSPNGFVVANFDDPNVRAVCENLPSAQVHWFGEHEEAQYRLNSAEIFKNDEKIFDLILKIPGKHNLFNALAVVAVSTELHLDAEKIKKALENYQGAARRFELKGKIGHTLLYDDYAHHPTEIKATLKAVRQKFGPDKRILCIFQPHQFSRTYKLLDGFAQAFTDADEVIIPNIYKVRDSVSDLKNMSPELLVQSIAAHHPNVRFGHGLEETVDSLQKTLKNYDIILTMGAGDVWKVAEMIINI